MIQRGGGGWGLISKGLLLWSYLFTRENGQIIANWDYKTFFSKFVWKWRRRKRCSIFVCMWLLEWFLSSDGSRHKLSRLLEWLFHLPLCVLEWVRGIVKGDSDLVHHPPDCLGPDQWHILPSCPVCLMLHLYQPTTAKNKKRTRKNSFLRRNACSLLYRGEHLYCLDTHTSLLSMLT